MSVPATVDGGADDHIRLKLHEFRRVSLHALRVGGGEAIENLKVLALVPSSRLKRSAKLFDVASSRIVFGQTRQNSNSLLTPWLCSCQ